MNSMPKIITAHNSKIANREYTENDQIFDATAETEMTAHLMVNFENSLFC